MDVNSPEYKQAMIDYLRRGVPMDWSLKRGKNPNFRRENVPEVYIWRTRGDNRVSPEHAANNGKRFTRDNPPPTGHPGEEYRCRCVAEPIEAEERGYAIQSVTSVVDEGLYRWRWYDFILHYYFGRGASINLSHVGHSQDVINVSRQHVFKGVEKQVSEEARNVLSGKLSGSFINNYPYYSVSFIHGRSTVKGNYNGLVTQVGNMLHVDVEVTYNFSDKFTDPLDIRERNTGSSSTEAIQADELINSEIGGQHYDLLGNWTTRLTATTYKDVNESSFRG